MKKIIVTCLFVFMFTNIFAQNFRFGLQFNPLMTWMKSDAKSISFSGIGTGFDYGLFLDCNITDNYAISTELSIKHSGGKISFDSTHIYLADTVPGGTKVDHRLQYIELPITLKLKTNEIGYITYYGQFGFTPGVNIKARGNIDAIDDVYDKTKVDIRDEVKTFNVSLTIGAGIEYNLGGNTSLLIGAVFNNGFMDVTDDDDKVILNNLAIRLGILF